MQYRDFDLQIVPDGRDAFVVHARIGSGEAREALAGDPVACLDEGERTSAAGDRVSAPVREERDRRRGECLFRSLIHGEVRALFDRCRGEADAAGEGVRVRLRIDPRDGRLAALEALPWELLHDRRTGQFMSLDPWTPVVRTHDVHLRPRLPDPGPAPRILLAGAEVADEMPLRLSEERRRVEKAFAGRGDVIVETLAHTRRSRLVEMLQDGAYDVLHLMMHGDDEEGHGCLLFEDAYGGPDPVSGDDLARQLGAGPRPRLVVLNACLTAASSPTNAMTSVASALVRRGCPAVIAMTSEIADDAAITFTGRLYERLAQGDRLEEAVARARLAVAAGVPDRSAQWSLPAIFLSPPADTTLFPEGAKKPESQVDAPPKEQPIEPTLPPGAIFKTKAKRIDNQYNINAGTVSIGAAAGEK